MDANKKIVVGVIIAGVLTVLVGGIIYFRRQISKAMNYCYRFSGVQFRSLTKDAVGIDIYMVFKNFSDFALTLKGYDLDVYCVLVKSV